MKQVTLPFGAAPTKQPKRPIVLDDADSDEAQEPVTKETEQDLGISTSKAASSPNRTSKKPRLDYPASDPMHIPDLPFDISEVLPKVEPRVIKKDSQELDLLYFNGFIAGAGTRRKDFFEYLRSALPFYRVKYTVRGIAINTPRYTTVFGCDPTDAKPSVYKIKPRAIPKGEHCCMYVSCSDPMTRTAAAAPQCSTTSRIGWKSVQTPSTILSWSTTTRTATTAYHGTRTTNPFLVLCRASRPSR